MTKWMRNRLVALFTVLLVALALLAGCGGAKEAPKAEPAPAAATPAPAPAPQVDKAAIVKEAVVGFFGAIPPNTNMIEGAALKAKVEGKDATIYLLDIRKPEDFAKGHIAGAVNIPMGKVGAELNKFPKDKQIVVMCYSGQTSGQTVAALRIAGYNAISLKGGFPSWEKAGGAVAK
ncbi:MAG: rhodanese-like domain-containing protein [Bacillota bacterium]